MEELQDAIEDAQYMNAMHDELPRPTKPWKYPAAEEINQYIQNLRLTNPNMLEMDGMVQGSLGFYLFCKFVEDQTSASTPEDMQISQSDRACVDFLQDVAIYRARLQDCSVYDFAQKIYESYLKPGADGTPLSNAFLTVGADGSPIPKPRRKVPSSVYHPSFSNGEVKRESTSTKFFISLPTLSTQRSFTKDSSGHSVDFLSNGGGSGGSAGTLASRSETDGKASKSFHSSKSIGNTTFTSSVSEDLVNELQTNAIELRLSSTFSGTDNDTENEIHLVGNDSFDSILEVFGRGKQNDFATNWSFYKESGAATGCLGISEDIAARVLELLILYNEHVESMDRSPAGRALKTKYLSLFNQCDEIVYNYLKHKYSAIFESSKQYQKFFELMALSKRKIVESDFSLFRVLGRGGFGLVNGCKRAQTGCLLAMKAMNKKRIKLKRSESLCLNERNVLTIIDSQFVVCMKYAFTTQSEIFMILDLMQGGDLAFHLRRRRKFTEDEARYYVARTVLGVGALHEHQIVYRDLKPENILMDEEGRTKISDMGLAYKMPKSGISGTCGTRGYWAPEMLRRDANGKKEKYNLSVDWFSLGVCTYEFLYGIGPFRTERAKNWGDFAKIEKADREKAIDLAIREMEPEYEETISPEAIDLIQSLLKKNPNERLGSNGGAVEIMSHPWFSNIEWDNLNTCKAPIIPTKDINMQTQSEIGSFSDEKSAKQLDLNEQDHKHYEKWDYVSIKSFQQEMVDFLYFEELGNSSDSLNNSNKGCCTIS